jgi:hypothetical protein
MIWFSIHKANTGTINNISNGGTQIAISSLQNIFKISKKTASAAVFTLLLSSSKGCQFDCMKFKTSHSRRDSTSSMQLIRDFKSYMINMVILKSTPK